MAAQAILSYVSHTTYPDSESISSSSLSSTDLVSLIASLKTEQESTRAEIRTLSQSTAGDIDSWISQAKTLQADILRSRDTARQIVADAEAGQALKAEVEDKARKVDLLEKEVEFNEALTGTLEHVQHANDLIDRTQEAAVTGDIARCVQGMEDAEASILALQGLSSSPQSSRAVEILNGRRQELMDSLVETATEFWNGFNSVDDEEKTVTLNGPRFPTETPDATVDEINLEDIARGAEALEILPNLVETLAKDLQRIILKPRMLTDADKLLAKITFSRTTISGKGQNADLSAAALFQDLNAILDFIHNRLPDRISRMLSQSLVPALAKLLEEHWLDPVIPLSMAELARFTPIVQETETLAEQIEGYGWAGADALREWVESVPRTWLTKRREAVLGNVRNLVFTGLHERKMVERVETRVVRKDDPAIKDANEAGGEDAWDEEWDEPEGKPQDQVTEDEDMSAWDEEDESEEKQEEPSENQDEDDAWGAWDDDEAAAKPPSPVIAKKQPQPTKANDKQAPPASSEQEMTLRETFTVTSIPDGILQTLQQIISDAETLASPDYSSSPLSPASQALYTLPTLALAIYRATAPTAYGKVDVGNMLTYNDALRLADLLRSWQDSRPPGSGRLRLDNDVTALETFAKKAYSTEMESQRTILRDLLDGAQGFSNCTVPPFKQECESAVDGAIARLRDVHTLWKDVLSQGAILQSLGSLLSTVTNKMVSEIEDLGDISEADSHQLHALCERFNSATGMFTQSSSSHGGEAQDMTFIYSPTWLKFQYLAEILESSLADIKWMWKEGELSLEFDADEVVELVEALFAESDLRRQAVREIRAGR